MSDDDELEISSLTHEQRRRGARLSGTSRPLRRRMLAAAGVVAASNVVLAIIIGSLTGTVPVWNGIASRLSPPTPEPLAIGAGTVYLVHEVPWGMLTIDGHRQSLNQTALFPPAGIGQGQPTIVLSRGSHTLVYRADPFPVLRCIITAPSSPRDTCPIAQTPPPFRLARVVDLKITPEHLTLTQLMNLAQVVQSAVDQHEPASTVVAAGELYRAANGAVVAASQPMQVAPAWSVNRTTGFSESDSAGTCYAICEGYGSNTAEARMVDARIQLAWNYNTLDGRPVVKFAPAAGSAAEALVDVPIAVTWHGGWGVTIGTRDLANISCQVANALFMPYVSAQGGATVNVWTPRPAATAAQGCLILGGNATDVNGTPVGTTYAVMYQNGVVLAANDNAHTLLPNLPLASPRQQTLVGTWPVS